MKISDIKKLSEDKSTIYPSHLSHKNSDEGQMVKTF